MKNSIATIGFMLFGLIGFSQDNAISTYFASYEDSDEYTRITISSVMFELFTNIEANTDQDQDVLDAISKLDMIKIIINDSATDSESLYLDAIDKPNAEYEVLMTIEDKEEDLTFFIRESDGIINELLLIGSSSNSFFIMVLLGEIDLKQISNLAGTMQFDGVDKLDHIENQ